MIHCVSTMNEEYYNGMGQVMIKTWLEFFPSNYCLHLYLEDFTLDIQDDRLIIEDWNDVNSLFEEWDKINYNTNDRSKKFTKKALSQIAAWRKLQSGKMLWVDADIVFLNPVPVDMFDKVLGNYPLGSWGESQFESGTVFMNLDHPDFLAIKDQYENIYCRTKTLPEGEKWFDGELLGWACVAAGRKHRDLWCFCDYKKTSTPMNRSWIGEYMQHFKAKRKNNLKEELIKYYNRPDLAKLL